MSVVEVGILIAIFVAIVLAIKVEAEKPPRW